MNLVFDGKTIELTSNGYLVSQEDWQEGLAIQMAEEDSISLTERHWDLIKYLRDEYFNNAGSQPNTRNMVKAMSNIWGEKIDTKVLYDLFPLDPSKQGGRIAGLPESKRKGGY